MEYALEFCTLAAESGWGNSALRAIFLRGLNSDIFIELACWDDEVTLDALIEMTIRLDNLLDR